MHDTHFVLLFFQLACSKTIQLKIDFHQNFLFFDNSYSSLKHCKSIIYLKKWNFIGWSSVHIDQWKECFKTALQIIYYLSFVIFDSCGLVVYLILFDFHPLISPFQSRFSWSLLIFELFKYFHFVLNSYQYWIFIKRFINLANYKAALSSKTD